MTEPEPSRRNLRHAELSHSRRHDLLERLGSPRREEREGAALQLHSMGIETAWLVREAWRSVERGEEPLNCGSAHIENVMRAAACCDDRRLTGLLCEMWCFGTPAARWRVVLFLQTHLPNLTPDEAATVTDLQRWIIYRLLRHSDTALQIAVLTFCERYADGNVLSEVEPLRTAAAATVREAARTCANALRVRLENERQAQTLLRGTMAPADQHDILLRPVGSPTTPNAAATLLRPNDAPVPRQ